MVTYPGENAMTLFKKIFANGWTSLTGLIGSFSALLLPVVPAIITAFAFILVDLYYGYKVSRKYGNKEFESHKLWKTINKLTEAFLLITLAAFLDKFIFLTYESLTAVRFAAGAVCTAEILSLLESFRALHPKAILSRILQKIIKSKAEKYLEVDISDIIDNKDITNDTNYKHSKKHA